MTGTETVSALPKTVRIGPFDFAIEPSSVHDTSGRREWGTCSVTAQKISIQAEMPSPMKAVDTFLHESLHALYWAYNVQDDDKEERIVGTLSTALTALHRDNPWLAGWITRALA